MKIFLTSNQQFGRPSALKTNKRPFDSMTDMHDFMIKQWNSTVSKKDAVFVLGNFVWDPEIGEQVLAALNGEIYVIEGEYDRASEEIVELKKHDDKKIRFISDGIKKMLKTKSVLSYWPLADWPKKKQGFISFIGHPNYKKYKSSHKSKIVNVCCDAWDFKPIDLTKLTTLYNDPDLLND